MSGVTTKLRPFVRNVRLLQHRDNPVAIAGTSEIGSSILTLRVAVVRRANSLSRCWRARSRSPK